MAKLKTEKTEEKTAGDIMHGGNARGALFNYVERMERLNEEKAGIAEDLKEVAGEAKAEGFDVGMIRKVIQRRKVDRASRDEADALLEVYEEAVEAEEKARFNQSAKDGE